ncbi:MAG: hypothetical protein Q9M48_00210, partial [Rhodobacterales bacterium]|nr:hypothetical protein [Rhodobacterales bacterium]
VLSPTQASKTALPLLRSNLISGVACIVPTPEIRKAAATAATRKKLWAEIQQDCRAFDGGIAPEGRGLWTAGENLFDKEWQQARAGLDGDWAFWRDWYQGALDGVVPDWKMLEEIALIAPEVWNQGPAVVNGVIAGIVDRYRKAKNRPSKTITSAPIAELMTATLYDFSFDQQEKVMRAIPMAADWKHLTDPEVLKAFLQDAGDVREGFELLSAGLEAEGRGMQEAGGVRTYLNAALQEISNAQDVGALRVGKLLEYGKMIEAAALSDETRREFGPLAQPLQECADNLRNLIATHFSNTLARFAILRDVRMEEDATPWEVLQDFRDIVEAVASGNNGDYPELAAADVAVLQDILDSVEAKMRAIDGTSDESFNSSLRRDVDFQLAKVGATAGVYRDRAGKVVGKSGDATDAALKWVKRGKGMRELGELIKEYLFGG